MKLDVVSKRKFYYDANGIWKILSKEITIMSWR